MLTPEFVAFTEKEERYRPNPGTVIVEILTGVRFPAWSMMFWDAKRLPIPLGYPVPLGRCWCRLNCVSLDAMEFSALLL